MVKVPLKLNISIVLFKGGKKMPIKSINMKVMKNNKNVFLSQVARSTDQLKL